MPPETIIALAAAAGGWGTAILGWMRARQNDKAHVAETKADAAETVVQAALTLVAPLQARVDVLEASLASANRRITSLEQENRELRSRVA